MKFLFFAAALCFSFYTTGQNPFKKHLLPSTFEVFHQRTMIFNSKFIDDKRIKAAFIDTKILTEAQLNTALKYAQMSEYPDALNSPEELMKIDAYQRIKYKAYWIGSWTEFFPAISNFRQMHLVWIPKDENLGLAVDYIPKSDEGFYVITRSISSDKLPFVAASSVATSSIVKKISAKKLRVADTLTDLYNRIMPDYGHALGSFYTVLKMNYQLTDDEIDIVSRSAAIDGWPDSLKLTNRKALAFPKLNNVNYFKVGEVAGEYGVNGLFWVEPGQIFATGFTPKSDLGFFFVARLNENEKKSIQDKENVAYLNSPWWLGNVSSTQAYNPETFEFPNAGGSTVASNSITSSSGTTKNSTVTTYNGVTIATANLERRQKRSGVIILYYGNNRIVSDVSLFVVEFDKNTSEESMADRLRKRVYGVNPYMYFEFKEGFDCSSAQSYLRRKGIRNTPCTY